MKHHYNPKLKFYARNHRNNPTKAEDFLWQNLLRKKQLNGFAFLRQRSIHMYIADFYCKELKLIIETDGYTHLLKGAKERDLKRTKVLEDLGYFLIRFDDSEVIYDLDKVKVKIINFIEDKIIKMKNN